MNIKNFLFRCPSRWKMSLLKRSVSLDVFFRYFVRDSFNFQKYDIYQPLSSAQFRKLPEIVIKMPYSKDVKSESKNPLTELEKLNHLANLLNCSINEIQQLTKRRPKILSNTDTKSMSEKVSLLLERFSREAVKENLWILELSLDDLRSRIAEVDKWELSSIADKLLPLFKLSRLDFFRLSAKFIVEKNIIPGGNRIVFIANEMQCPVEKVVERFMSFQSLLFRNFRPVKENVRLLKEFGLTGDELLQEFVVLKITPEKLKARLEEMVKCKMVKHLWLISASEKSFRRKVELEKENVSVLGEGKSIEEYICEKLNLSSREMLELKLSNPEIFKKNPAKIRNVLEFLLSRGYTTNQICLNTKIMHHDFDKVKKRYAELTGYGVELPKIKLLCLSQTFYDGIIRRLEKNSQENSSKESKDKDKSTNKKR